VTVSVDGYAPARTTRLKDEYGMEILLKRVKRHRNGVSGVGFYSVEFIWVDEDGQARHMLGWIHDRNWADEEPGDLCFGVVDQTDPTTTWRGDNFREVLDKAARAYSRALGRQLAGRS
jgi:hypothetical protein